MAEDMRKYEMCQSCAESSPSPDARATQSRRVSPVNMAEEMRNPGYAIPEIGVDAFIQSILPPLKGEISFEGVMSSLEREGFVRSDHGCSGTEAETTMANEGKDKEREMFAPLMDLFERAVSLASISVPHHKQTIRMSLLSRHYRNTGRRIPLPSGYFYLRDKNCTVSRKTNRPVSFSWLDVALTAELSKDETDETRKNNARKVISNMQQVLARDPSRRFTFGITVENTNVCLWFCSRGTPVVSEPFDFTSEFHPLIHAFLSLAFATKEELGWDPTVRPFVRKDGRRAYHIDVGSKIYETVEPLARSSAGELVGHATRVWKVRRVGSEEINVLKDVWVEEDRELEHDIYDMVLRDIERKWGVDVRKEVASHLLTPVAHWLVPVNEEEDHTTKVMMRGYSPSFSQIFKVNIEGVGVVRECETSPSTNDLEIHDSERHLGDPLPWYNPLREVPGRRHYRVVLKEAAKALHSVRDLSDCFTVLIDSSKALSRIHGSGWVHRDVSPGNLYLYDGRGLIGDLEFAKRKNSDVVHELRTGTPDFIAVEAAKRSYLFLSGDGGIKDEWNGDTLCEGSVDDLDCDDEADLSPRFFHNDLHDLESIWWIAVWALFSNFVGPETDIGDLEARERDIEREGATAELFSGDDSRIDRNLFLKNANAYYASVTWMPSCLRGIKGALQTLRVSLLRKYLEFEAGFPTIRLDILEGLHDKFVRHLGRCRDFAKDLRLTPYETVDQRLRRAAVKDAVQPTLASPVISMRGSDEHKPCGLPFSSLSPDSFFTKEMEDVSIPTECWAKSAKRKRDDDDNLSSMRPLRMPRYELQVC